MQVEEMNVCDNLGDHLVGNVFVKFKREEDAEKAVADLNNRWWAHSHDSDLSKIYIDSTRFSEPNALNLYPDTEYWP